MAERTSQIEKQVLEFLKDHAGVVFKQKKIAKSLKISSAKYVHFKQVVKKLADDGKIEYDMRNSFYLPDISRQVAGVISFNSKGTAFVTTEEGDEFYISQNDSHTALHHDTVLIEKLRDQSGKNPEGRVIRVLKRSTGRNFGILHRSPTKWLVKLESPAPIINVEITGNYNRIHEGQLVELCDLIWENPRVLPKAKIRQILGSPEDPKDDFVIIKKKFALTNTFPKKVEQELLNIEFPNVRNELFSRIDLRDEKIFTIDPEDAKDFDDAVSLTQDENDNWNLGVHIADVSYYVRERTAIDLEARKRGTSIYFPDGVIPMLPEKISNTICSLQPNEDRLTYSVMMKINSQGEFLDYQIRPSIICSKRRFNYVEVQNILDKQEGDYYVTLSKMRSLSKVLKQRRKANGSIDFDLPEPIIKMNSQGIPFDIRPSVRLESHELIEEFMLSANRCVTEYVALRRKNERLPFIYRVHEPPLKDTIEKFFTILRQLGLNFSRPKDFTSRDLQNILEAVKGMPYQNFIENVALRSMTKAVYSYRPLGHFGLAFKYYTHFTSPIRRYPDLIVHRLLKLYSSQFSNEDVMFYRHQMPHITKQSSENEIRAMEIEREYIKIKQIRFIAQKIGKWYSGVITGLIEFGFFVEITQFLIEGFVHVRTLDDDFYIFDEEKYQLRGRRYKRTFRLGDVVTVRVASVSLADKQVDFEWGE